jgi:AraC-like DNA-binding protein
VRSPGVYFSQTTNTTGNLDVRNIRAQIIPSRGSYLEFLTEWVKEERKPMARYGKPIVQVQVDRKTKVSATIFLKALGLSEDEIRAEFADIKDAVAKNAKAWTIDVDLIENTLEYDKSKAYATNNIISKVVHFMNENIENHLSIDDLATFCAYSPSYFYRRFVAEMGLPPLTYFMRMKMNKASILLITTNMQVNQVASKIGFTDSFHFSRVFSKHIGMSPQKFRKQGFRL